MEFNTLGQRVERFQVTTMKEDSKRCKEKLKFFCKAMTF
jgi:hypothetical protein